MVSAPPHRAIKTQETFDQYKSTCIPAKEWMPYSPDMVSMDYAINGNLKTNLKRRVARDRGQLVRAIKYQWLKIKLLTIRRTLRSWPKRVKMMVERFGDDVENILS